MKTYDIPKMDRMLKRGWIELKIVRNGRRWIGVTPQGETLDPHGFGSRGKKEFKDWIGSRYLAEVYTDTAFINTRWAMKNPRFAGTFGGLPELCNLLRAQA